MTYWKALRILIVLTLLTGVIYPAVVTLIAQSAFPTEANGHLLQKGTQTIGSVLIGQKFTETRYFWSRPSATDYNPLPSSGSNQGPTNATLQKALQERGAALIQAHALPAGAPLPKDLLFASGSGLDPHISPEAARFQISRVAKARGLSQEQTQHLRDLVEQTVEGPQFGLLGEARVNVLELNLALDRSF